MCVSLMHQDIRLLILYSHWLMDLMMVLYYQRKYMYRLYTEVEVSMASGEVRLSDFLIWQVIFNY